MSSQIQSSLTEEDEISLVDVVYFITQNWRFISMTTLAITGIALIIFLIYPQKHKKQITISVEPLFFSLPNSYDSAKEEPESPTTSFGNTDINQLNYQAIHILTNHYKKIPEVQANPQYVAEGQQINLTLSSPDTKLLQEKATQISKILYKGFQGTIQDTLAVQLLNTELNIARQQAILAELERTIAKFDNQSIAQLTLEKERSESLSTLASWQYDQKYLKQAQEDLLKFTKQLIDVEVSQESTLSPTSSLYQKLVLTFILSLIIALIAALIRQQIAYWRENNLLKEHRSSINTL